MEGMLNDEFRISGISNKPFCPFEINQGIEMPLIEMDPDVQFYSESQNRGEAMYMYLMYLIDFRWTSTETKSFQ